MRHQNNADARQRENTLRVDIDINEANGLSPPPATQRGWESLSPLKGDASSNEIQSVLSTWPLSAWFLSTWILSQLLFSSWPSAFLRARMRAWHTHHVPEQLTCNWLSLRAGHTHHVLEQLTCIWLSCCAILTATVPDQN